jgi:hypothetical protein
MAENELVTLVILTNSDAPLNGESITYGMVAQAVSRRNHQLVLQTVSQPPDTGKAYRHSASSWNETGIDPADKLTRPRHTFVRAPLRKIVGYETRAYFLESR